MSANTTSAAPDTIDNTHESAAATVERPEQADATRTIAAATDDFRRRMAREERQEMRWIKNRNGVFQ